MGDGLFVGEVALAESNFSMRQGGLVGHGFVSLACDSSKAHGWVLI